jgi:hypothetical protein
VLDRTLRRAATRRSAKPGLPYNPRNPYDTPDVGLDNTSVQSDESEQAASGPAAGQDSRSGENSQSMLGPEVSSRQPQTMSQPQISTPPPPIPPSSRRRHRSQLSAEDIETQAHKERMENRRARIESLKQAKAEAELEKEEMELQEQLKEIEAWKEK